MLPNLRIPSKVLPLGSMSNLRWKIAQSAEIRWWQRYLKGRSPEDYLPWKRQYWLDLLTRLQLRPAGEARILDAGCGPAGIFMVFDQQTVDAVDPLLDAYETRLTHFRSADYPKVQFHACALEDFKWQAPYDYVFCLNAINHVADLGRCFDQLVESTAPNGQLIVSIDAHNYWGFKHLFRLLPGDILHPHQYDLREYQAMLEERGCTITQSVRYRSGFFFDYYILVAQRAS